MIGLNIARAGYVRGNGWRATAPMLVSATVSILVLAAAPAAAQQGLRADGGPSASAINYDTPRLEQRLQAVRATGPMTLDGALNEPAWQDAPVARHFIQNDPREGEPATYDTEVRVVYDDNAIYFGVYAKDEEPERIIVSDIKEDFNTSASDEFAVVIDTFQDGRNGYQFATNPAGAKWDSQLANEGREINADWDGIWDVATRIAPTGWYAELRIPFRTLKFSQADVGAVVYFQRLSRRTAGSLSW